MWSEREGRFAGQVTLRRNSRRQTEAWQKCSGRLEQLCFCRQISGSTFRPEEYLLRHTFNMHDKTLINQHSTHFLHSGFPVDLSRLYKCLQASDGPSQYQSMNVTLAFICLSHEQIRNMSPNMVLVTNGIPSEDLLQVSCID